MTKKIILSITLLVALFATVHAQTIIPSIGFTGSTNSGSIDNDVEDYNKKSKPGITAGVAYQYTIMPLGKGLLSAQAGLYYIQKGVKATSTYIVASEGDWYVNGYTKEDYKLNYLQVPILIRYEMGPENFRYYVNAGPSIGYGLGGKYDVSFRYTDDYYEPFNIKGDIKFGDAPNGYEGDNMYLENKIDFGMQFGAGITLYKYINVDVRYGLGLSDVTDEEASKNKVLQVTVGVPIHLK